VAAAAGEGGGGLAAGGRASGASEQTALALLEGYWRLLDMSKRHFNPKYRSTGLAPTLPPHLLPPPSTQSEQGPSFCAHSFFFSPVTFSLFLGCSISCVPLLPVCPLPVQLLATSCGRPQPRWLPAACRSPLLLGFLFSAPPGHCSHTRCAAQRRSPLAAQRHGRRATTPLALPRRPRSTSRLSSLIPTLGLGHTGSTPPASLTWEGRELYLG